MHVSVEERRAIYHTRSTWHRHANASYTKDRCSFPSMIYCVL